MLILCLISVLFLPNAFSQDYTKWGLPEGVKMRLGKGTITGNIAFSPDSSLLAVASYIGIWIYDGHTGKELNLITMNDERWIHSKYSIQSGWENPCKLQRYGILPMGCKIGQS